MAGSLRLKSEYKKPLVREMANQSLDGKRSAAIGTGVFLYIETHGMINIEHSDGTVTNLPGAPRRARYSVKVDGGFKISNPGDSSASFRYKLFSF